MTVITPAPRKQNPVRHSKNKIKLGVFGFNIEGGCTLTNAPERHRAADWQNNVAIAQMADRAGMEMLLPVGRWRGWEGIAIRWACPMKPTPGQLDWLL